MSFGCKSSLEWCTLLPSPDHPRKSPVFVLQGNEWFFCFLYEKSGSSWYFEVYLELHSKRREIKETSVKFQIGFKKEETLSLKTGECKISEHREVWYMSVGELQAKLPSDYLDGNWIKFIFNFVDVADPFIEIINKSEKPTTSYNLPTTGDIHLEALSKDFSKLFDDHSSSDVDVTCDGKTFKIHKIILSSRSEVFAKMCSSNMLECSTGKIKVEDCKAEIFQSFLRYLYSGKLPELNFESAKQLYEVSDKYIVLDLRRACSDFLTNHLTEDNACEVLLLADQHSDEDFRKNVVSYIIDEKIPEGDTHWPNFCKNHCNLAIEIMLLYIQKRKAPK